MTPPPKPSRPELPERPFRYKPTVIDYIETILLWFVLGGLILGGAWLSVNLPAGIC